MTTTATDLHLDCQAEATSLFVTSAIEHRKTLTAGDWKLAEAAMHAGIAGTLAALQRAGMLAGGAR